MEVLKSMEPAGVWENMHLTQNTALQTYLHPPPIVDIGESLVSDAQFHKYRIVYNSAQWKKANPLTILLMELNMYIYASV